MRSPFVVALLASLLAPDRPSGPAPPPWDRALKRVWPVVAAWTPAQEEDYAAFVARLGQAVAEGRCHTVAACLRDPAANALFEPADASLPELRLQADCADLPYLLRAYFSFRRLLPFAFVAAIDGVGRDPRYMRRIRPRERRSARDYLTLSGLWRGLRGTVHSGMYRLAPEVAGDFYPVAIRRGAVRPGAVFYDPHGHVLVVVRVRPDGVVHFIDAHPDGTLTYRRFGADLVPGSRALGGGFKRFRPAAGGQPDFDGTSQWDPAAWQVDGRPAPYHAWVRARLMEPGAHLDEVTDFREQVAALCRAVAERVVQVELAVARGLPRRGHPGTLPENIYGATGDWEAYATPARDARLKAQLRELHRTAVAAARRPALAAAWRAERGCRFSYRNSAGRDVALALDDVLDRLFDLSFDPYHCPELRWGAPPGSPERSTCPDDPLALRLYDLERRLRHRIDRAYDAPTPPESGPTAPPEIDVRRVLELDSVSPR